MLNKRSAQPRALTPKRITELAQRSYFDAVDMLSCVAVLEAGNTAEVQEAIDELEAGWAANLIRNALFQRLTISATRVFEPAKPGDEHLAVIVTALDRDPALYGMFRMPYRLREARDLWELTSTDPSITGMRHARNKLAVHSSAVDPAIPIPRIGETFGFVAKAAKVCEAFAFATEATNLDVLSQVVAYRDGAEALWASAVRGARTIGPAY